MMQISLPTMVENPRYEITLLSVNSVLFLLTAQDKLSAEISKEKNKENL
jgi:hypothetical protein